MQCSHPNHSSWYSSHCLTAESAHRFCEFSLQTIPELVHDAFRISFVGKLQTTAAENIFQQRLVDLYLMSPDLIAAGGDRVAARLAFVEGARFLALISEPKRARPKQYAQSI